MEPIRPRTSGPRKPIFVTFYSFKGGVGRTMALLNAAAILAGRGRRVLMIDFDLEAPGLTLFQDRQLGEGASREQAGLVDALRQFIDTPRKAALAEEDTTRFFETYVTSLSIPESVRKLEDGQLDLMPAGRLDDKYERHLHNLKFEELFEQGVGKPLFDRFKAVIRDSGRYEYVLIDSRTGFSDEGSICTQYLGDYLVVVTGLNRQNIRGTGRFLNRAKVAERKQRLMLVASPVPMFYEKERDKRLGIARQMLADAGLDDIQFTAQIPYHPMLALDEDPSVYSYTKTNIFEAYEEIVETLYVWANDRPQERINEAIGRLNSGNVEEGIAILQNVSKEEPHQVLQAITNVAGFLVDQTPKRAAEIFEVGLEIAQSLKDEFSEIKLLTHVGAAWYYAGDFSSAINSYQQAIDLSHQIGNQRAEAGNLSNLGNVYAELGETSKAIKKYKRALGISRNIDYRSWEGVVLGNLGLIYSELGETRKAIEYHKQALAISHEVGNHHEEQRNLRKLGRTYGRLGQMSEALDVIRQAYEFTEELDSPSLRASFYIDKAEALSYIQPKKAWDELSMSWEFILEHADVFERTQAHVLRARLLAEQEKYTEAAEAAQTALTFYQERGVDSVWSREAEELLGKAQAHQG